MAFKVLFATVLLICVALEWTSAKSLKQTANDRQYMIVGLLRALRQQKSLLNSAITSMHVESIVNSRLAKVKIETNMENSEDKTKEKAFSVRLPESAFISKFTMVVDGLEYAGKVEKKKAAQEEYEGARDGGDSAGLVTADTGETQTFRVATNVPARSNVTFTLVYHELLKRKSGKYEHSIFINPDQIVEELSVDVYITEQPDITGVETRNPKNTRGFRGEMPKDVIIDTSVRQSRHNAQVTFKPSEMQQRRLLTIPERDRKVTVCYDVTPELLGGEIQTRDGYFVHFVAPHDLPVLSKSIVFVIDVSGSMSGKNIQQAKIALETILKDISDSSDDIEFNIVAFSWSTSVWKRNAMIRATQESIENAILYVKSLTAGGSSNFNRGLLEATKLLSDDKHNSRISAIIILSDGGPTSGVTNERQIRQNIEKNSSRKISVLCLGFGNNLNHDFLKKLANDSNGISRRIYADSDAGLQLKGFFYEVATPLLLNSRMKYSDSNARAVDQPQLKAMYGGWGITINGMENKNQVVNVIITGTKDGEEVKGVARGINNDDVYPPQDSGDSCDVMKNIWAYLTIKGLLEKKYLAETETERQRYMDEVMELALKYSFVTPLTSMIAVAS